MNWNCDEFAEVLAQLNMWLESRDTEHTNANGLASPQLPSSGNVMQAVQAQRVHLEAILRPVIDQSSRAGTDASASTNDGNGAGTETLPSNTASEGSAVASGGSSELQAIARRLQDLPQFLALVLDVLAKLWQVQERSSKQQDSVQELSRRLQSSEWELAESREEQAEAAERESYREMRLCRMMAQEAREASELRESLRQAEQSANHADAVEEKKAERTQLRRCQQELAKAQRRNTELLKDLKLLCTPSNAGESAGVKKMPSDQSAEDQGWNPLSGIKAMFGNDAGNSLGEMMRLDKALPSTPRSRGGYGSLGGGTGKSGSEDPPANGTGAPAGVTTPRGGSKASQGPMTPRSLASGASGGTTPRGMPSSMRELAQIIAPQKLVPVDQASPEARVSQLQKLVRELTVDLQERDSRISQLVREVRRVRNSSSGVSVLEVLGESEEFSMQDGSLSARGVRGEGTLGSSTTSTAHPKIQRLNLPLRTVEDPEDCIAFEPQPRLTVQSAR